MIEPSTGADRHTATTAAMSILRSFLAPPTYGTTVTARRRLSPATDYRDLSNP